MAMATMALYISELSTNYAAPNAENLSITDRTNEVREMTAEINQSIYRITTSESRVDMVGEFFSAGYEILKGTVKSIGITIGLVNDATDKIPYAGMFKGFLMVIIVVAFLFIIVGAVLNREL